MAKKKATKAKKKAPKRAALKTSPGKGQKAAAKTADKGSKLQKKGKAKAAAGNSKKSGAKGQTEKELARDKAISLLDQATNQMGDYLSPQEEVQVNEHGEQICREAACEGLSTSGGYCRLHYIKNWKKIKRRELILKEGKLNQYIEELVLKYPEKYIEIIRNDLASDREFNKVVHDLELDEGIDEFDSESESIDSLIDNIRRDMEDEGDSY